MSDQVAASAIVTIGQHMPALTNTACDYASMARATTTAKAYQSAMRTFGAWCEAHGVQAMPANPESVADYLADRVNAGIKVSTLQTALAAIVSAHRLSGYELDTRTGLLAATWGGIRRVRASEADQAEPLTRADLQALLTMIGTATLADMRDRSLLAFGLMSGRRRSELAGLYLESTNNGDGFVRITANGIETILRRSKSSKGEAKSFYMARSDSPVAIAALETWIEAAKIEVGTPLFRPVNRWGQVGADQMCDKAIADVLKRRMAELGRHRGMTNNEAERFAAAYSGHSMRVGIAVEAINAGASHEHVADHLGHSSTDMTRRYAKRASKGKALAGVGV